VLDFFQLKPTDAFEHGGIFSEFSTHRRRNACRSEGKIEEDLDLSDDDLHLNIFERPDEENVNVQLEYS